MKSETRSNKSVRILSLLTLLTILVTSFCITNRVNAAGKPNLSQTYINCSTYSSVRYYAAGDTLRVEGVLRNIAEGEVHLEVNIYKCSGTSKTLVKSAADVSSYEPGPTVSVSNFTVNQQLATYKLPVGDFKCEIKVWNTDLNDVVVFSSCELDFKVVATNTNEYVFVNNHLAKQFGMSKGWALHNTVLLKTRQKRASVIAKEAIDSYLKNNPKGNTRTFVTKLYKALLYREPDPDGLNWWVSAINAGKPLKEVTTWWTSVDNVEFIVLLRNKGLWNH